MVHGRTTVPLKLFILFIYWVFHWSAIWILEASKSANLNEKLISTFILMRLLQWNKISMSISFPFLFNLEFLYLVQFQRILEIETFSGISLLSIAHQFLYCSIFSSFSLWRERDNFWSSSSSSRSCNSTSCNSRSCNSRSCNSRSCNNTFVSPGFWRQDSGQS